LFIAANVRINTVLIGFFEESEEADENQRNYTGCRIVKPHEGLKTPSEAERKNDN